jgi:hypothetical protein
MTITLAAVAIRHERRVRLAFTAEIGPGAYKADLYRVENFDGLAPGVPVRKALLVPNSPAVVELQLDADLAQGRLYRFFAEGVPALAGGVTSVGTFVDAAVSREPGGAPIGAPQPKGTALEVLLYGRDLGWTNGDLAETLSGDLELASGRAVAEADLARRLLSAGLPWDASYGLQAQEDIDGSPFALPVLRGRAIEQVYADDRVAEVDVTVYVARLGEPALVVRYRLVGDDRHEARQIPLRRP